MAEVQHTAERAFDAALIDLDGTLLDTIPDLAFAANAMRVDLGEAPLREDVLTTFVGKGIENLVRRTLAANLDGGEVDEDLMQRGLASFRHHYHLVNGDKAQVYDGVLDGLKALRDQGIALAVVTNKPTEFTEPLLARTGLAGFFQVVVCGDTCAKKKPDPMPLLHACERLGVTPGRSLAIGDSINDAVAARAAGCRVLAVPYGYNEGRDVRTLDVDGIVASLLDAARWAADPSAVPAA
ncbi:Phosphoglycolate phosphatase [plant metagenome]|uniref:phosphoglycolate phosphatase n=1 Tax=plant metagenome TaxID=1297885 RepID=A0A484T577_9ZZZZ